MLSSRLAAIPPVNLARACIAVFDLCGVLAAAAVLSCGLVSPAYAYVDPSVMTYAVQAVAGVAVAMSAVVGVAFRRTRRRLLLALGIDPDAKAKIDPPFLPLECEMPEAVGLSCEDLAAVPSPSNDRPLSTAERSPYAPKWPIRFATALACCFMATFTLLFVAPVEIMCGSSSDFAASPWDVAPLLLGTVALISLAAALVLSLLRGRGFLYPCAAVFAVGAGFYVQALLLNAGLPVADGNAVDWARYDRAAIVSAVVWASIGIGVLAFAQYRKRAAQVAVVALSAALVLVQGVGVGVALADARSQATGDDATSVTEVGLFDVAPDSNVVVIVLDTYDIAYLDAALASQPDLLDSFTGFTYFDNVSGAMIPTRYGIPYLLTGAWPIEGESWQTFLQQRYARSSFLGDLDSAGLGVGVYTDTLRLDHVSAESAIADVASKTQNVVEGNVARLDVKGTLEALVGCALYRDLPWVMKPRFWYTTDDVREGMLDRSGNSVGPRETVYARDDAGYYERLKENGLTVDSGMTQGAFRFIHLTGPHSPFVMNAEGKYVGAGKSSRIEQAVGSMRIAAEYISELKRLGVYDSATIVITADHGEWHLTSEGPESPSAPIVLAKPAQAAEESARPLAISHAPVRHGDILPTIAQAIGADASAYDGKSLFDYDGSEPADAPRSYLTTLSDGKADTEIVEYVITGDVMDFSNWRKSGVTWDARS